jgi:hypothetical protein
VRVNTRRLFWGKTSDLANSVPFVQKLAHFEHGQLRMQTSRRVRSIVYTQTGSSIKVGHLFFGLPLPDGGNGTM